MPPEAARWLDGRVLGAHEPWPASDAPGVFETLRCEGGALGFEREHLARLAHGARALGLDFPPPWDARAALHALARTLGRAAHALRLTWQPPHLALAARVLAAPPAAPLAILSDPGALALPEPSGVKSVRRRAYDERRARALAQGAFEVLVRTADGALVEGTIGNLFVAVDGVLATPPLASGALPGIVRASVLTELERAPLRTPDGRAWRALERRLTADDLARAEELLLTNSLVRVLGVARLADERGAVLGDALAGADGPLARALEARVAARERSQREPG